MHLCVVIRHQLVSQIDGIPHDLLVSNARFILFIGPAPRLLVRAFGSVVVSAERVESSKYVPLGAELWTRITVVTTDVSASKPVAMEALQHDFNH